MHSASYQDSQRAAEAVAGMRKCTERPSRVWTERSRDPPSSPLCEKLLTAARYT